MSGYHRQTVAACNKQIDDLVKELHAERAVIAHLDHVVESLGDDIDAKDVENLELQAKIENATKPKPRKASKAGK